MRLLNVCAAALLLAGGCLVVGAAARQQPAATAPPSGVERHLKNIRQLTQGGENAEAYFSQDGSRLIYQSTRPDTRATRFTR